MTQPDGTSPVHTASDGERIFAALPPARGRAFARTWWGARWLKALEEGALEAEALRRGRGFARQGAVGAVSVRPGRITAVVRGRDGTPHRADVLLRELTQAEWDRLLDVASGESGHLAALLDGEMPPRLVEDAESAGVDLLPGIGDLEPTCGCDAWDHCPHTAALCYQMARLLDQDPFVLLLLRGRPEEELLDDVARRGTEGAAAAEPAGVPAEEAFALGAVQAPLPAPPPPVRDPGGAPSLRSGAPPQDGVDPAALEFLAADAALRAARMLGEALAPGHAGSVPPPPWPAALTRRQDAVRLGAAGAARPVEERLADGCGFTLAEYRSAVRAWELGGAAALSVWEEPWTPSPREMARMHDRLATAWDGDENRTGDGENRAEGGSREGGEGRYDRTGARPETPPLVHVTANRWSTPDGSAQLRYGRDGRWWPYREESGTWWPAGPPENDPAAALAVAAGQDDPGRDGSR